MVPLDRALVSSYRVSIVVIAIFSGLAANCNAKFSHASTIRVRENSFLLT